MACYVDSLAIDPAAQRRRHGHLWCNLLADDKAELHRFALSIGCKREWAHRSYRGIPYYRLTKAKREAAVAAGAVDDPEEFGRCLSRWRRNFNDRRKRA